MKLISILGLSSAAILAVAGLSQFSRAQVVQNMNQAHRSYLDEGEPLFEMAYEHKGVRLEVRMHTFGLSAPGFSVDVWNDDPNAPEFFDVSAAQGTVVLDGNEAGFFSYPPSIERPLGGRRALILPSWSSWPALPFQGKDLGFELSDSTDPSLSLRGHARNVRG